MRPQWGQRFLDVAELFRIFVVMRVGIEVRWSHG